MQLKEYSKKSLPRGLSAGGHQRSDLCPIYVDLDGTLLASDSLWESILLLLKRRPIKFLQMLSWLPGGKAIFKSRLAQYIELDPAGLPYRENVLSFLELERNAGRELILATASDQRVANSVAEYLGIFSNVIASDGQVNLSGQQKLKAMEEHGGGKKFDYIGNSSVDLPIWQSANQSILVEPSSRLLHRARKVSSVGKVFPLEANRLKTVFSALRIQQWVKNLLLFVPIIAAHQIRDLDLWVQTSYAFVAFGLCASSVYIINDLFDLESDRQHPHKKHRPFASGALQIKTGLLLAAVSLFLGFVLAFALLSLFFVAVLALYFMVTLAYTLRLKRLLVIDVLVLAGLYTLRVVAGGVVGEIVLSPWLLAFSMFLFLSLAFVKRYVELNICQSNNGRKLQGRGYNVKDIEMLKSMGPVSGFLSVLVLALYTNNPETTTLYQHPGFLWFVCVCLLYWIIRIWIHANRGTLADDPLLFAFKDRISYMVGGLIVILILLATV